VVGTESPLNNQRGQDVSVVVGIPVKDEIDEIAGCLLALAAQQGAAVDAVVLCLNNCTDGSALAVRRVAKDLPFAMHVLDVHLPPDRAGAGVARRIAMDRAADLAGANGVVLSTDADGRATPGWVAANLGSFRHGADAVAGQAEIDPEGAKMIPAHLHAIDAQENAYAMLLDEIRSLLDPDPADPWPRHDEHSGASIGVTVEAYRRAGGIPPVALAEDRAFFDAVRRIDAAIRHAPDARVVVSARVVGRAPGGMADTIRRRMQCVDEFLDDRLESVTDAVRRVRLRVRLRTAWQTGNRIDRTLPANLGFSVHEIEGVLAARYFGMAWAEVEDRSPALRRWRVSLAELPAQTARAEHLRNTLRVADAAKRAADRADTALLAAAQ
jgi:Glycosyl transferase family 2